MCGIVGVAGRITANEEKAFKYLLCLDTLRGEDSTGIYVSRKYKVGPQDNRSEVFKTLGTPWDFFREFSPNEVFKGCLEVLIGHNRAATKGVIDVDNAHPFNYEKLVGVHNGTVYNHRELDGGEKFNSDSAAIFNHMNMHGPRDTMRKLDGAFCLVWWDKEKRTINLARNNQRTMNYAISTDRKTIFWSSDADFLNLTIKKFNLKMLPTQSLPEGQLHSIEISEKYADELGPFRVSKVEFLPPKVINHGGFLHGRGGNVVNARQVETTNKNLKAKLEALLKKEVEFKFTSYIKASNSGAYLSMTSVEHPEVKGRIYVANENDKWANMLMTNPSIRLVGKPKRIMHGVYPALVIDRRTLSIAVKKNTNVVPIKNSQAVLDLYKDPYGSYVSRNEFLRLVMNGCYCCDDPIDPNDHDRVVWNRGGEVCCPTCQLDENMMWYFRGGQHAVH